jgi:hypothetical protein
MPTVRTRIPFTVVLLVVAILVGTQISELFDSWDNTFQTGNDIEFSLTVVALCVGACVWLASLLLRCFQSLVSKIGSFLFKQLVLFFARTLEVQCGVLSASPPPLRI